MKVFKYEKNLSDASRVVHMSIAEITLTPKAWTGKIKETTGIMYIT